MKIIARFCEIIDRIMMSELLDALLGLLILCMLVVTVAISCAYIAVLFWKGIT